MRFSFVWFGSWGRFSNLTDVPHNIVVTLTSQLNLAHVTVPSRYREGEGEMRYDHVHEIMAEYGYQDFASQPGLFRFLRWLYARAWWSEECLTVLFYLAMGASHRPQSAASRGPCVGSGHFQYAWTHV